MGGGSPYRTLGAASNALVTVLALLPKRLLVRAVATYHALRPFHFMPICLLLMTQVTWEAPPTAWEPQPPGHRQTGVLCLPDCCHHAVVTSACMHSCHVATTILAML